MALLTIAQAADLLGVSAKTIGRRIYAGIVKAEKAKDVLRPDRGIRLGVHTVEEVPQRLRSVIRRL